MTSTFADTVAQDLALYLAARDVTEDIPKGVRLTPHQVRMLQVVSDFYPTCPASEDGAHNRSVVSAPYQTTVNGKVLTATWRKCTCGLVEGTEYYQR
ncbi:hypothetical protein [Actinophytocola sp.]|uniref:hypothetical protein n=1 Tax=Actinophytocola sp. TaxID=1872138 RepID=UPI002D7F2C40|nr:hypothetical protein [Actinophytocola sp.]HET9144031.1 hypothetical protein [Actinophytocola sp.]